MAIEERKTKAQRREEQRQQRKAQEAAAAKQASRRNVTTAVGALVLVLLVGAGVYFAVDNSGIGGGQEAESTITREAALAAYESAECETLVDNAPLEDRTHHEIAAAPPADVMYASSPVRPTTSGPHYSTYSEPIGGIPNEPIDERSLTHNLEHGSMAIWFDPGKVDGGTESAIEDYMQSRKDMGFQSRAGGSVFASPYDEISSGKPIALRLWGVAVDCETWDPLVADRLLIDYWGSHGDAPENFLSEYPASALGYEDEEVVEDPATPSEGTEPEDVGSEATEILTESESEAESEPAADASATESEG